MDADAAQTLLDACQNGPAFFATEILGVHPWSLQCSILDSVRIRRRTAVKACRGVGKTFIAAVIVLWFLYTHGPDAKVITTAPTQHQVDNMLWAAVRKLHAQAEDRGFTLGGWPTKNRLELDAEWYAVGLSSNDPDRYLGFHAHAILWLVDEASGVEQAILDAAKGYGTGAVSRVLYIGNGTKTSGGLYDAFADGSDLWHGITISMFDSPNMTEAAVAEYPRVKAYMELHGLPYSTEVVPPHVARELPSPEVVDEALQEWGPDHPLFAVFVLGEFPGQGMNTVVGINDVLAAQARYAAWEPSEGIDTSDVMCDVARFGDDETAIGVLDYGDEYDRISIVDSYNGQDTVWTTGAIMEAVGTIEESGRRVGRIVVDDAGVGGGVTDQLRKNQRAGLLDASIRIIGFNGGGKAKKRGKGGYPKARSEAWFTFKDRLARVALEPCKKLLADLVAPTYELNGAGEREVEKKKDTKKRLKRSPDRADTVLMGYAPSGAMAVGKASKGSLWS